MSLSMPPSKKGDFYEVTEVIGSDDKACHCYQSEKATGNSGNKNQCVTTCYLFI